MLEDCRRGGDVCSGEDTDAKQIRGYVLLWCSHDVAAAYLSEASQFSPLPEAEAPPKAQTRSSTSHVGTPAFFWQDQFGLWATTTQVSDPSKFSNLFVFVSSQQKKCRGRSV